MKKIIVVGLGVQGSTIAKRMDEHPLVREIICADYEEKAAEELGTELGKATPLKLDARALEQVVRAAEGCDLIVNALPLTFNPIIMEAALCVKADYLDMAGPMEKIGFVESYKRLFSVWHEQFKAKGLTALVGCGSAPGLANVVARQSVSRLDICDTIGIYIYEGLETKRFTPFWWSPEVAFKDMAYKTFRFENGAHVADKPFSRPIMMTFKGIDRPVRMVDHEHDEPVTMGLLADAVLKGVKNVDFKYGGFGVELSEKLYRMGLLSQKPVDLKGSSVVPLDLVLELCPPAPKYPEEIQAIVDEGVVCEEAAFLVRVDGLKEGKAVRIDAYVNATGLIEAFERSGLTHEAYLTGQCASVFVQMMVEDVFMEKGVHVPEQFDAAARKFYFAQLADLGVTVDDFIETRGD